jgi:TetR/AcrR family acrAB operon transcriptional repressor
MHVCIGDRGFSEDPCREEIAVRRTREEALETRDRIIDSAEQVFVAKGVAAATLADIASAAGVTRGAIYGHFSNKADVFHAMVARVKLPMDALFEAANHRRAQDPLATLKAALSACLREVAINARARRVFGVLLTNRAIGAEDWLLERATMNGVEGRARLVRGLRNGMRKGQLPADLDPERAAALLKAALGGLLRDWLMDSTAFALPDDADRLADAMLDMLRFSPALRKPRRRASRSTAS